MLGCELAVRPFLERVGQELLRIDPKEVREKHLDNPTGVATVADMNRDDRLTLTGKVRVLRIGTVAGKAVLDASGLEAEEVVVSGDISENAVVKLNAPKGRVTVGGHVVGVAKLTVTAPGGEFVVSAGSGKLGGACEVSVTAKRVAVRGPMAGTAKLVITLTADGSAQFGTIEDKAVVLYKE